MLTGYIACVAQIGMNKGIFFTLNFDESFLSYWLNCILHSKKRLVRFY